MDFSEWESRYGTTIIWFDDVITFTFLLCLIVLPAT